MARSTIRFIYRGEIRELTGFDGGMTVLDYLRQVEKRRGTKEGCAEGDCGACTVVLGELEQGNIRLKAVNACLQFLPTLDGKLLLTIEDLAADGTLHPVQKAMIETHGSQCGFCTPGLVMSMFALSHETDTPDRNQIDEALAGNLCRCTGYGPIIAAMEAVAPAADADAIGMRARRHVELLSEIAVDRSVELRSEGRCYYAPIHVTELADWLADNPDATVLAGGTDVGLWVTKQHRDLKRIAYVGQVRELKEISETAKAISVGAAATYSEALPLISVNYPDFGELLRRLGARQVRNLGTIGGNIANGSPIGDCPPALIALGAKLHLRRSGVMRSLPLEAFFIDYGKQDLEPGEFVERIEIPKLAPGQQFRAYKISKRFDQDISAVCGAFRATLVDGVVDDVRICFGGMAGTPKRATSCEAMLSGRPWNEALVLDGAAALEKDYQPISDMRASAHYRMRVAKNLLLKFYIETSDPTSSTRVRDDGATTLVTHV